MKTRIIYTSVFVFLVALSTGWLMLYSEADKPIVPAYQASEALPAGEATVGYKPFPSFMLPSANLPTTEKSDFHAGKALAHQPWVKAPTITIARDGLGPLYNARTCLMCHINGGRGIMPATTKHENFTHFLRLSIPGQNEFGGPLPEPTYGDQLQAQSTALAHQLRHLKMDYGPKEVKPEARVEVSWQASTFRYPDGQEVNLRKPSITLKNLGYGEMHPQTLTSLRNAPPILGVGLIEAIPQTQIDALADPDDQDRNGISGKVNQVWDFEANTTRPGRFGLKANQVSVRAQTAGALHGDMGIANPVFPEQPCTENQPTCLNQITGADTPDGLEITEELLTLMVNFTRNLAVPLRRQPEAESVQAGRHLFYQTGCVACHHPSFTTGEVKDFAHLSGQTIWPYSDFLLHDMGEDLADGRPDYLANGNEWRTPPLWGIGLSKKVNGGQNFLHDGRARTIEEAILWHGGEAESVKQSFIALPAQKRQQLLEFVKDL